MLGSSKSINPTSKLIVPWVWRNKKDMYKKEKHKELDTLHSLEDTHKGALTSDSSCKFPGSPGHHHFLFAEDENQRSH